MFQYIIKRLLILVITLFGITAITFALTRLTPGDPAALKVQGSGGRLGAQSVGGYEDLVELNRRNLGLDKPMFINLEFEDRTTLARKVLKDFTHKEEFWRKNAEQKLSRVSTIALEPALEVLEANLDNQDNAGRLARLMSRLAATSDANPPADPREALDFWERWLAENQSRFEHDSVREAVQAYIQAPEAELDPKGREVFRRGGYAVPFLIEYLNSKKPEDVFRAHIALQSQTGFSYATNREDYNKQAEDINLRWNSWWRRESLSYGKISPLTQAVNIFRNTQFGLWTLQAITFDFGDSYMKRRPVISMMGEALPISVLISGLSIIIGYLIAIPLGIFSAIRRNTITDRFLTVILFVLYSLPSFWVAGILLLTTTGPPFVDWFPTRGLNSAGVTFGAEGVSSFKWLLDRTWHLVLPVTCLTYGSLAFISRQMRSAMLEVINQDYIRTAQAKGLTWRSVIFKHALRNSLIPILTISASLLPELIAGAIIIESIFTIPGMGMLTFEAIVNRDYPVINAVLFFSAFLTLIGILLADLSYALADPRIKYE